MNSSPQFVPMVTMPVYEPIHQSNMWEKYSNDLSSITDAPTIVQLDTSVDNKSEEAYEPIAPLENSQEGRRTLDKVSRRLAQNREAARKSRLKKKAYVQQLETNRLKLTKMEQELTKVKQQVQRRMLFAVCGTSPLGSSFHMNSGTTKFEMEYGYWVEEQQRQIHHLRNVLQANIGEVELRMLVEGGLNHYYNLFLLKAEAAKADVFYLMSGKWRTPIEHYFHWLGGFRPSDLLNIIVPQLDPLLEQQQAIDKVRQSIQQAEDVLSQGVERLKQTLAKSCSAEPAHSSASYRFQTASAFEQLEALESFLNQADHLRQQSLQEISRVLTVRQTAGGLLALGEYFQRLRALSSLWAARSLETQRKY